MNKVKNFLLGFAVGLLSAAVYQLIVFHTINRLILIGGLFSGCIELFICFTGFGNTDAENEKMIDY